LGPNTLLQPAFSEEIGATFPEENVLGRSLAADPSGRSRLRPIRADLDPMVLGVFEGALTDVGAPTVDHAQSVHDDLDTLERLGLT